MRALRPPILALACLLIPNVAAGADRKEQQIWPELDVYYRLNPNTRLFFLVAPTGEVEGGQSADWTDGQIGAHVEVGLFPIAKGRRAKSRFDNDRMSYVRFRTGLRYLEAVGDESNEWRVIGELSGRARLPAEMLLVLRNRLDLRWIDEAYSWRYRPRLWLERELKVGTHMAFVPYGSAEIYWDSRPDDWNRQRYQLGTAIVLKPWFAPEVYWAHQIDEGSDGNTISDALGVAFAFYF